MLYQLSYASLNHEYTVAAWGFRGSFAATLPHGHGSVAS
ncbi:hypothetical protein SBA4_480006 [Candidatus Sulfopaludibacter sp. SbA4]|nr:hypothetical protein SBA4_480006 [Candidatus Sulfopaludibacter sp. SbA4]